MNCKQHQTRPNPSRPCTKFIIIFLIVQFYLFLMELGLHCCVGLSLVAVACFSLWWFLLLWSTGLWASVMAAGGSILGAPRLWSSGSIVVVHGLSCSTACGIFLDQGSNPCLLHWQVDSVPLSHQRSPLPRVFDVHNCYVALILGYLSH